MSIPDAEKGGIIGSALFIAAILAIATGGYAASVAIVIDSSFTSIRPIVGVWEFTATGTGMLTVRGDKWETAPEASAVSILDDMFKGLPESVMDEVKAYYYFPLALVPASDFNGGTLSVEIQPVAGRLDQAGGIAYGMASPDEYWVLRLNSREDNIILFQYIKAKRFTRHIHRVTIEKERWYRLSVRVAGKRMNALLDGHFLFEYDMPATVRGKVGLWSKADSVTGFRNFVVDTAAAPLEPGHFQSGRREESKEAQ